MTPSLNITKACEFLLLGDSHAAAIGRAAREMGIDFAGGPLGSGREFNVGFYRWQGQDLEFKAKRSQELYRKFLEDCAVSSVAELDKPVVCTFGLGLHFFATTENWDIYRDDSGLFADGFLQGPLFADLIAAMAEDAIRFYGDLADRNIRVFAVLPPQRVPDLSEPDVFLAAQEVMMARLKAVGADIIDVRTVACDETGWQKPEFAQQGDPLHGNAAFGRLVLETLLPRMRQAA
ncbi:hypothetical protein [Aestuariispira insulae]|uniref:GDSL-like lipase/acylhydrolase family protein n=1 Tax=Aestuariispira insulae TaxID=1461337 RepID=A0A3D9H9I0_9PROT|nr:hypothetical protein [Aestuariispira insulae]RED45831.1 hypothetical protein DFP90_11178 [Aestuariispira insulae]